MSVTQRPLLDIVTSHPIQYQAPLWRDLASRDSLRVRVHFLSRHGLEASFDPGFQEEIRFDVPLTEGYSHLFRRDFALSSNPAGFLGHINPRYVLPSTLNGDVAMFHGYAQMSMWFAAIGRRVVKRPYMIRGESRLDTEARMPAWKKKIKHETVGRFVSGAEVCLPIGVANREFYSAYGVSPDQMIDAPYSVDNAYFSSTIQQVRNSREELLVNLGLSPDLPTVIFAGKLVAWKRPQDILEVCRANPSLFNLIVVGTGPLEGALRAMYSGAPNIAMVGFQNQSQLRDLYGLSDVVVLPSEFEPWGLVLNEAMAAGCLPVASRAVGAAQDLVAPTTGAIFETGNISDLALKLGLALDRLTDSESLRQVATTIARFDISATADGIEEGFFRALEARH